MQMTKKELANYANYYVKKAAEQCEKARYWEQKYNELKRKISELAKNTK